jgi:hypothetical protein
MQAFLFYIVIHHSDWLERILTMVYVELGYLVSGLYPLSSVQKNKSDENTTFGPVIETSSF